jgi:hypothetical protein
MDTDWLIYGLAIIGTLLLGALMVLLYGAIIVLCALGIEWVFDYFSIGIDRTIYWTGVAILILFCAFGKTKIENKSD